MIHAEYGGVVPEVAARAHCAKSFALLRELGVPHDGAGIDAVAVTAGPGLLPSLRVGVTLATSLAWAWNRPLVPVNHLEGHVYSVWLDGKAPEFPALALLVSGGHTEIVLMRGHGQYELIGSTRDDAAGEAFDKVAKMLGLGYPGGPEVSRSAAKGDASMAPFPRPMAKSGDYDFSFSGLKTAVAVFLREHPEARVEDVCAGFEEAVVDTLVAKTVAAARLAKVKSVIVAGGVSANRRLREEIGVRLGALGGSAPTLHLPPLPLTGDNAAMIAVAGYFRFTSGVTVDPVALVPDPNLRLA
jgi:N6-L-threonylcarbamoyladenine synthase